MFLTVLSSQRSKDPNTQVGACIVDDDNRICAIGYNGFPRGCPDSGPDALPWAREGAADAKGLDTKYPYVVHAECNAILNKNSSSVKGARMYVGLFPCNECAKMIIQSGIREVVFMSDKYGNEPSNVASRRMFDLSGVTYRKHAPKTAQVSLSLGGL
jgi:dCMP deaminase